MKNKLRSLYLLQLLDTELDELRELRGDLPESVRKLEDTVNELRTRIEDSAAALRTGVTERTRMEKDSLELIAKIEKYKSQQLQVQNNKEYDALTHEIEMAEETIQRYEQEIEMFVGEAEEIKSQKIELEEELETLAKELSEKTEELKSVLAVTAEEETRLEGKRDEAIANIGAADLELYTRIRNAKVKAVAPIKRNACSGCFNVVPPQLILEIKKNIRMYVCEHCGRILVSEDLAADTRIE